jgi:hypothetical protein
MPHRRCAQMPALPEESHFKQTADDPPNMWSNGPSSFNWRLIQRRTIVANVQPSSNVVTPNTRIMNPTQAVLEARGYWRFQRTKIERRMLVEEGLAEGKELGSNGLLSWGG